MDVSRKKKKKSDEPEIPTVVKTKQFEWAAAKIRYTMNKLYMYKMSVVWISGVILSVVILWLLIDTPHVYHNMHAFREGFITQEFLFEDSHIQKCYLDVDEAVCYLCSRISFTICLLFHAPCLLSISVG